MASRKIIECTPLLITAWKEAEQEWERIYPELPKPFITCTHRSNAEQDELYTHGRTIKGAKVTNAKAGQSPHNYNPSFAFDIAFIGLNKKLDWSNELFRLFAQIIKQDNITWGGDFKTMKDNPHFEVKEWKKKL